LIITPLLLASLVAQTPPQPPVAGEQILPVELEKKPEEPRNRVGLNYRMGLNITADFKHLGGYTGTNPGRPNGTVNRNYDNGYNRVDITGNNHGPGFEDTTWYWGYADPGSVRGDSIVLTSSSAPNAAFSKHNGDDPQHGFEFTYSRELYRNPKHDWRAGAEAGLGYTRMSINDTRKLTTVVTTISDTYVVPGGVVVPPSDYQGTFEGPGAIIDSDPERNFSISSSLTSSVTGKREMDANIFALRLGPYAEVPLGKGWSFMLGGGVYMAVGDITFRFNETVRISGFEPQSRSSSDSETEFLVGGYVGGSIGYALTDDVMLTAGAQFQSTGRTLQRHSGKTATLDMGEAVIVSVGASYAF